MVIHVVNHHRDTWGAFKNYYYLDIHNPNQLNEVFEDIPDIVNWWKLPHNYAHRPREGVERRPGRNPK